MFNQGAQYSRLVSATRTDLKNFVSRLWIKRFCQQGNDEWAANGLRFCQSAMPYRGKLCYAGARE